MGSDTVDVPSTGWRIAVKSQRDDDEEPVYIQMNNLVVIDGIAVLLMDGSHEEDYYSLGHIV